MQIEALELERRIVSARAARLADLELLGAELLAGLLAGAVVVEPWGDDGRIEWRIVWLPGIYQARRIVRSVMHGVDGGWHDATDEPDRSWASAAHSLTDHLLRRRFHGRPRVTCPVCGGAWADGGCVDGCGRR